MTKLSHPIMSCAVAYSRRIGGRSRLLAHSRHVVVPRPRKYLRSKAFALRCVPEVSIHFLTTFVDSWNAASWYTSGQQAMCLHVSLHSWQLGHRGLRPSWCDRNSMVPATPRTCLDAHSWNSCDRSWSVLKTDLQSMALNCLWDRCVFCGSNSAQVDDAPRIEYFPPYLTSSSPLGHTHTILRGNSLPGADCSWPSVAIWNFAAWSQMQFSCAFLSRFWKEVWSSWCALVCK